MHITKRQYLDSSFSLEWRMTDLDIWIHPTHLTSGSMRMHFLTVLHFMLLWLLGIWLKPNRRFLCQNSKFVMSYDQLTGECTVNSTKSSWTAISNLWFYTQCSFAYIIWHELWNVINRMKPIKKNQLSLHSLINDWVVTSAASTAWFCIFGRYSLSEFFCNNTPEILFQCQKKNSLTRSFNPYFYVLQVFL